MQSYFITAVYFLGCGALAAWGVSVLFWRDGAEKFARMWLGGIRNQVSNEAWSAMVRRMVPPRIVGLPFAAIGLFMLVRPLLQIFARNPDENPPAIAQFPPAHANKVAAFPAFLALAIALFVLFGPTGGISIGKISIGRTNAPRTAASRIPGLAMLAVALYLLYRYFTD
jgi:hypothetical protein